MSMPDHRQHSFRILAIVAAVGLMAGFWLLRDAAAAATSRSVVLANRSRISVVDVTLAPTNVDINFGPSHLHVKTMEDTVQVTNLDTKNPPWFKVISIVDNHDQPVARTGSTWDYGTSLTIRVTVPENADYITLALARTDHRFVEFRVKPTLRDEP